MKPVDRSRIASTISVALIVFALSILSSRGLTDANAAPSEGAALPTPAESAMAAMPANLTKAAESPAWVELIAVEGSINPAVAAFIEDSIDDARTGGARALIIELDTPGGMLSSTQRIVKDLLNSAVPVIVYVAPSGASAASAGTLVTEAANIAAMAPGTTIGAAHPVGEGGGELKGAMAKKVENFTASFARSIARERGRNQDWVEQAVRQSVAAGDEEALKLHVVDIVASDLPSLLAQASGRTVTVAGRTIVLHLADAAVRRREMTAGQRLLNVLADPNLVYLLLMGGILGLYFEFAHPGVFLPGVAGAICLLLALSSFEVLPINLAGFMLLILGVAMLIAEVYVTSYGILGIGGVIAFVIGSLFLIDTARTNVVVSRGIIAGAASAMTLAILGLGYVVMRERRRRPTTGREGLVGEIGEVREAIGPGAPGRLFVHGESWQAESDEAMAAGVRARVTGVRGLHLTVRREN